MHIIHMSCTREEARPSRSALAVDDEACIRALLQAFLTQQGWRCRSAAGADEALGLLERESFTHALVDLHLGKESGYDLISEIARRRSEVRIVAVTGSLLASPERGCPRAPWRSWPSRSPPSRTSFLPLEKRIAVSPRLPGWITSRKRAVIAVVSAALYALLAGLGRPKEMLQATFAARVALFFVTALFASGLAREAQENQDRLRRVQGFYRTIFDESADGVLVVGSDGLVRETNSRAVEMLGEDPTGQPVSQILDVSDTHIRRVIGNGQAPDPKAAPLPLFTMNLRPAVRVHTRRTPGLIARFPV